MISQQEAIRVLEKILNIVISEHYNKCTGNIDTCPVEECMLCSVRDCPDNEPLHYHHDGCPACAAFEKLMDERSER